MRLTFISNLYPPYIVGGNEMLCAQVVSALRRRGHVVSVICGRGRRLPAEGVHGVLEIDLDRKHETFLGGRTPGHAEAFRLHYFSPRSYAATRRWLARLDPEVVVVWNLYLTSLAPLVAARASGRPVVTHVADKWLAAGLASAVPPPAGAGLLRDTAFRLAGRLARPLLRRATRPKPIVAISQFIKDFYVRAGFPAADIEVIHLGVATHELTAPVRAPKPPGEPLRLLYVGSLWEGKGPQLALRALRQLVCSGHDVRLDVCGDGPQHFLAWLRSIVAEEGLEGYVAFHGFQAPDRVRAFMQTSDVLVFPSQWDEPFAAVPVEAMSCGMAIAATTAGGTPEAITHGETGLLVPPGEPDALVGALRRLIEDAPLRRRLGEAAARAARERFDFEGYTDRLERLYAKVDRGQGGGDGFSGRPRAVAAVTDAPR